MSKNVTEAKKVVSLFGVRKKPPELVLDAPNVVDAPAIKAVQTVGYTVPAGKPKLVLAIGPGRVGKSTLLRWIGERSLDSSDIALATLAPNRTLKHYFPETAHPEGDSTSAGAVFLEQFLDAVAEVKRNALIDFPGDDTALLHLLRQGANPVSMLADAGVEVVALYVLSTRVEDLTAVSQLAKLGFTPGATALVMNQGVTADPTLPPQPEFEAIMEHSVYRATLDQGAVPIWMPRLYSAKAIEERRLSFMRARKGDDLGPSDRSRTHYWWDAMEKAFAPIVSWLP